MDTLAFEEDFSRFMRASLQKYGYDYMRPILFRLGGECDGIGKYRYNLMEVFEKHRQKPLQVSSVVFLDKVRIRDEHHWIEYSDKPNIETWMYSKDGHTIAITVERLSGYTCIVLSIK